MGRNLGGRIVFCWGLQVRRLQLEGKKKKDFLLSAAELGLIMADDYVALKAAHMHFQEYSHVTYVSGLTLGRAEV